MSTPRERRERTPVDLDPDEPECPACQSTVQERYHTQRGVMRLDQHVKGVSPVLACGQTACTRPAAVYRPPQEDALAWRGDAWGLAVVARRGAWRYRPHVSMTTIRDQLQTASPRSRARQEVAWRCAVVGALVTTVAQQDEARMGPWSTVDGLVLAMEGVPPEKRHATLSMLRDVWSGRVVVAKTLRSSATGALASLIAEGRRGGLPLGGVLSEQPEALWCAGQHQRPTVPPPMCQEHSVPDVAPPVGAADRQVKQERPPKLRGSSELERQAEHAPRQAAPGVADSGLASRTVMRDAGQSPLAPPGVQLSPQVQRMAAAGERVMAAPPSALLHRLSRLLAVVHGCQKACAQLAILFSWSHQSTPLFTAHTRLAAAQSQRWTFVHERQQRGLPTARWRVVPSMEQITVACAPQLLAYVKPPRRPRTHHALALLSGRLKHSRRHSTGRKHSQECIRRAGRLVAMLCGLPEPNTWVDAFARVRANDVQQRLNRLRQPEKRRQCWHTRRD